ncbi:transmembrane protein TauE like protein [Pelagophyceae sp. CCMP2097]|nr:transmembrane protein TauE like protein [Pelagophyceae sp. CCMP2097]
MAAVALRQFGVGLGGGACIGLVGWGGGQVIIPSLAHPAVGGLSQLQASASSLFGLSFSATAGAATFARDGACDFRLAALIAVPSVVGARCGVLVARKLSGENLALVFDGLSTLLLPAHLAVQHYALQLKAKDEASAVGTAAFGFASGMLSAIMGVGGLPVIISYLTIATPLPHHLVQGTAMCAVAPAVVTSAVSHAWNGNVPFRAALCTSAGCLLGSVAGADVALRLSEDQLRYAYSASLVVLGGRSAIATMFGMYRKIQKRKLT